MYKRDSQPQPSPVLDLSFVQPQLAQRSTVVATRKGTGRHKELRPFTAYAGEQVRRVRELENNRSCRHLTFQRCYAEPPNGPKPSGLSPE